MNGLHIKNVFRSSFVQMNHDEDNTALTDVQLIEAFQKAFHTEIAQAAEFPGALEELRQKVGAFESLLSSQDERLPNFNVNIRTSNKMYKCV